MGVLLLDEQTAPDTPSTGQVVLYPKTDGFLYSKDDAGTETQLAVGGITLGTLQTATGTETEFDFSVASGAREVNVNLDGLSLSGTDGMLVQLGDSGGIEATDYDSASSRLGSGVATTSYTTGFGINTANAAHALKGTVRLLLVDEATNTWAASGHGKVGTDLTFVVGGTKSLSGELTTVRVTRTGTNTFDAGSLNIAYE
jgi:hypothetical protein